jgi:hypothetical protein
LNQGYTNNLNRSITSTEIKIVIKNLSTKKIPGLEGLIAEIYQTFNEELKPVVLKLFQIIEREGLIL